MNLKNFEILRRRFVEKQSLQAIGEAFGVTRETIRCRIEKTLNQLFYETELAKWKDKQKIGNTHNDLYNFIILMGQEHGARNKIMRIIKHLDIEHPSDFLKHKIDKLYSIMPNISPSFVLKIKIALLEMGYAYDFQSRSALEAKLESLRPKKSYLCNGKRLRFQILTRDNFTCQYCGRSPMTHPGTILHVDHKIPLSHNGSWEESNLITSCKECNLGKGDIAFR